ncbi:MAG: Holliday junction DNA helicase RuvA [Candidatus Omnitrophica bacterium]|nr:Holliday junction DNA helicase RuvA [Candidatus Omnitrophota bacterium]
MISKISGTITGKKDGAILIENGGLSYEVLVPLAVMKSLEKESTAEGRIELVTYHYFQMAQSSAVPVLIGFQNEVEREFFEKFISVSGIGPKAACKALAEPFSVIAGAVDSGDEEFLKRLPGIGARKAAEIIARLRGKVGKYGLIRDQGSAAGAGEKEDIRAEALAVLLQLQYKKGEAEDMIQKALEGSSEVSTSEELLNEVYRERKAT